MRHVAEKTKTPMETLYQDIGWPLNKKYGHAVDAFKLSITYGPSPNTPYTDFFPASSTLIHHSNRNPDVWAEVTFPSPAVQSELQSYISKRLTPQPTKVRADVEVTCFSFVTNYHLHEKEEANTVKIRGN